MKPGSKLKSAVSDVEVMVIRAARTGDLTCGGVPMVAERSGEQPAIDPAHAGTTPIGKRYQDATGEIELLCVKGGEGVLAIDGTALQLKDAKPLPSSD